MIEIFKKIWPYLLIVALALAIYAGFRYYAGKVEDLTQQNTVLQAQNAEVSNNYTTLQNMYSISIKQVEELQKQQKTSLAYVAELKDALIYIDLDKAYIADKDALLKEINEYERCYAKMLIKDPSYKCYKEKK